MKSLFIHFRQMFIERSMNLTGPLIGFQMCVILPKYMMIYDINHDTDTIENYFIYRSGNGRSISRCGSVH